MFIQEQLNDDRINDDNLRYLKGLGVDYLTINPLPENIFEAAAWTDYFRYRRAQAERHGLRLHNSAMSGPDEITLAQPERDRKIEQWCNILRGMGAAGVPTLGYNFKPIGNFRTRSAWGRGGTRFSTFDYEEYSDNVPDYPDKQIGEEQMWEHLEYFLERVIPVAEDNGVRMALHPDDPPIPEAMAGAARIVSSLHQYKRIFDLSLSPANGMLFCQGCVTEMGIDVYRAIREIGEQGKIVYVHFRNVRGTPRNFQEVFLDEGDVDMYRAMKTYRDVGFQGPFMMDHTPYIPADDQQRNGLAFAVGYIRAMIQAVYH